MSCMPRNMTIDSNIILYFVRFTFVSHSYSFNRLFFKSLPLLLRVVFFGESDMVNGVVDSDPAKSIV